MSRQVARLSTGVAAKVLAELDREVVAMERELGRLSTSVAPSTAYDLCRAFARAFEARLALRGCTILRCFAADQNGLAAAFARLPLGALFSPARVREACLVADGYQPYLVSPENGLRALIREAVEHFRAPSHDCLTRAHGALSAIVDAALSDASAAGRSPACEQALEEAASAALARWLAGARVVVDTLLDMESGFINADFFRQRARLSAEHDGGGGSGGGGDAHDSSSDGGAAGGSEPDDTSEREHAALASVSARLGEPGHFAYGYLWKKDHHASSSTPGGGWSRRFFLLDDRTCQLRYWRRATDHGGQAPRGQAVMTDCSLTEGPEALTFTLQRRGGGALLKGHGELTLRADNAETRRQWVSRLRAACAASARGAADAAASVLDSNADAGANGAYSLAQALGGASEEATFARIGRDAAAYVDQLRVALQASIPKAIMTALVRKAERELLTELYASLHALSAGALMDASAEQQASHARREALAQALPCVQEAAAALRAAASRGVGPDEKLPVPVDILMALRAAGALPDGAEAYLADAMSSASEDGGAAFSPASPVSPQQMTPASPRPGLPPRSPASAAAVAKAHIPLLKMPRRAPPPPPPSSPTSPDASAP